MYLLGFDIGSSSVKAALLDAATGKCVATAASPATEMPMHAPQAGWAEQDPNRWWQELVHATTLLHSIHTFGNNDVLAIGISYQMHGLVCVDENLQSLRPAIIWCDSRAVPMGNNALATLGEDYALSHLLNSPGNFTAAKLRWVKENQPELYAKIHKIMLPGDYIAMRLTGEPCTTQSGLSEGIFWDFTTQSISERLLDVMELDRNKIATIVPTFGIQGKVTPEAAAALGISAGVPVTYRAGDQPNNAFSLNVLEPGEAATTAGTSGVVYAVHDQIAFDPQSRVNTFIHVNHSTRNTRNGVLMCLNGTGILNSWLRQISGGMSYAQMNEVASKAPVGADGLLVFPFGNGAERILANKQLGARFEDINFNIHQQAHLLRAGQEGIVFALTYGVDIMRSMGLQINTVRAGETNMFLSPLFRQAFANTAGVTITLHNTDGAQGAARAAGVGVGYYAHPKEAFSGMEVLETILPNPSLQKQYQAIYEQWTSRLAKVLAE
ncbi:xylulokinase [Chitinophaga skermanii]|uniref:Xylulokinase n=1 Tax=Chitinophaga skermanii TaxID=331697 RepID=A0A327Q6R0_9BACT|nr:FGGY family carbohydrate kinase [Chitinophaga skermanii]RAJ00256.1 xylulokinase [Chitinophaga skermanii]